jgi:hypothetical protein
MSRTDATTSGRGRADSILSSSGKSSKWSARRPNGNVSTLGQNEGLAAGSRSPQHLHQTQDYGWASEGITAGSDAQVHGATPGTEIGVHHHGPEGVRNDTPAYIVLQFIIIT